MKKTYSAPVAYVHNLQPAQMMALSTQGDQSALTDGNYTPAGGGDGDNDVKEEHFLWDE